MNRLTTLFILFLLIALLFSAFPALAAEILPETGTISYTDNNYPIELSDTNTGADGNLYITDKNLAEAVVLNPHSGEYKVYILNIPPGDAGDVQPAPDGRIWFTDNVDQLGVFDPTGCSVQWDECPGKVWKFPELGADGDKINIGPFTFDNQGRVWVGDFGGTITRLYRATQTGNTSLEYCPYDIGFFHTHDLKFHDAAVWFGDYVAHRILQFNTNTEVLTSWPLGPAADPDGMTFGSDGSLWWTEISEQRVGRLTFGSTDMLTYYTIPGDAQPVAISIHSGKVWYSDKNGKIGVLDPGIAIPTSSAPIVEQNLGEINSTCSTLNPVIPVSGYFYETKTLQFNAFDPVLIPDTSNPGWKIFTLPGTAKPAGMSSVGDAVFVADSDTSTPNMGKLVRFTIPQDGYKVFLPLILR